MPRQACSTSTARTASEKRKRTDFFGCPACMPSGLEWKLGGQTEGVALTQPSSATRRLRGAVVFDDGADTHCLLAPKVKITMFDSLVASGAEKIWEDQTDSAR